MRGHAVPSRPRCPRGCDHVVRPALRFEVVILVRHAPAFVPAADPVEATAGGEVGAVPSGRVISRHDGQTARDLGRCLRSQRVAEPDTARNEVFHNHDRLV